MGVVRRLALVAVLAVSTGCSTPGGSAGPDSERTPPPLPTATAELGQGFEEQSGLHVPSDATDMEIEAELLEGSRPYYQLRFMTTRGGAEVICTADNFAASALEGPPDAQLKELFSVQEEDAEVSSHVECYGDHPTNGRIQRGVLVLFTEGGMRNDNGEPDGQDTAVVYAYSSVTPD